MVRVDFYVVHDYDYTDVEFIVNLAWVLCGEVAGFTC